jgi:hypothetical protein
MFAIRLIATDRRKQDCKSTTGACHLGALSKGRWLNAIARSGACRLAPPGVAPPAARLHAPSHLS